MPGTPPPAKTESEALIAYLTQQRDGLKYAAYGLDDDQIRRRATQSQLTVGGLIKHATLTEQNWLDTLLGRAGDTGQAGYRDTFTLTEGETLAGLIAGFDAVARQTEEAIRSLPSLDVAVQLPAAPWFPSDREGYTARWVVLHVIEELARHAGHADIIREHIDGATMYELMAGAEGWPQTAWLTPWRPKAGSAASLTG